MNNLIICCGLPRSGKSTWARKQGHPIVNPDSIRLAMHGKPFIGSMEPYVWAVARTMVKSLFLAGHEKVILDATNTTRKRRDDWASRDWCRSYMLFTTSMAVCLLRAEKQYSDDPESRLGLVEAIRRMHENYEPISEDEVRDWEQELIVENIA